MDIRQLATRLLDPKLSRASLVGNPVLTIFYRHIQVGDCYIHLAADASYIDIAISRGAVLVWLEGKENSIKMRDNIPIVARKNLKRDLPKLLQALYPINEKGQYIGVTGTNGKTSISEWIFSMFCTAQLSGAIIGTLGAQTSSDDTKWQTGYTTPDVAKLQQYLHKIAQQNIDHFVIETSSHALRQNRVVNIPYQIGIFTNLSRDHLDYHGDMEEYFQCKVKLFTDFDIKVAIINGDDEFGRRLLALLQQKHKQCRVISYSTKNQNAVVFGQLLAENTLQCHYADNVLKLAIPHIVPTTFNIENLLAVYCCGIALGLTAETLVRCFKLLSPPPGRLQQVPNSLEKSILIDFAHNPDSLEQTLCAVRALCSHKLWVVVGCGGDRDKGKRPKMARIACENADISIFTSDNPRSESPQAIIDDMVSGLSSEKFSTDVDRKSAIEYAINNSHKGDTIIISGRGHETMQTVGDRQIPFSDFEVVEQIIGHRDAAS